MFQQRHLTPPVLMMGVLLAVAGLLGFSSVVTLQHAAPMMYSVAFWVVLAIVASFFVGTHPVSLLVFLVCFNILVLAFNLVVIGPTLAEMGAFSREHLVAAIGARAAIEALMFSVLVVLVSTKDDCLYKCIIALAFLLFSFAWSDAGLMEKGVYTVNSFLPLFLLFVALPYVLERPALLRKYITYILATCGSIVLLGVVCYILFDDLYDYLRLDLYYTYRSRTGDAVAYGELPGPWRSRVEGHSFIRMSGTFADPVQWGYFLAFFTLYAFLASLRKTSVLGLVFTLVLLVMLLMSGVKGALLLFGSTLVLTWLYGKNKFTFYIGAVVILILSILVSLTVSSSASIHVEGLFGAFLALLAGGPTEWLLGYGIGTGGNLSTTVNPAVELSAFREVWLATGAESGIGVLVYQLGFSGLAVFVYLFWTILERVSSSVNVPHENKPVISAVLIAYFINLFLQENLVNSSFLLMLALFLILASNLPGRRFRAGESRKLVKISKQSIRRNA